MKTFKSNNRLHLLPFLLIFLYVEAGAQQFFETDFLYPSRHNIGWLKYSGAENFLYHHTSEQVFSLLEERKSDIASIKSLKEWQQRQDHVKNV